LKELKVVVVDDSVLIREYLHHVFADIQGCNVVGMAEDGNEALTMIRSLGPDLVILDISMPHRSGIDVLREIRKEDSDTVIVMFTADPCRILAEVCLKEGANHFISKTQARELFDICKALVEYRTERGSAG
jgi:DNA-binding NarL/FixJ family response regulator